MIGPGKILISHENGWSCTNNAIMSTEFDIIPGVKAAKQTFVVEARNVFDVIGTLVNGEYLCAFKHEDGLKFMFNARILGKSNIKKKLIVTSDFSNNCELIIKKIQKWQEQFKVS